VFGSQFVVIMYDIFDVHMCVPVLNMQYVLLCDIAILKWPKLPVNHKTERNETSRKQKVPMEEKELKLFREEHDENQNFLSVRVSS